MTLLGIFAVLLQKIIDEPLGSSMIFLFHRFYSTQTVVFFLTPTFLNDEGSYFATEMSGTPNTVEILANVERVKL